MVFRRQNDWQCVCYKRKQEDLTKKLMNRIPGTTTQQSVPVSSSAVVFEEPEVISAEVKNESSNEVHSHGGAQKQNAITRRSENDLTAMLQKERINESPRANIRKEDVTDLASALNSKNGGAEGVKEELAATFKNNGPGQHAKIAECMRQFAASGTDSYNEAYKSLKQEMSNWTKFDRTGMAQPAQRNFFKEVANLKGPGSARVKADVAVMIHNNIEQARKETTGTGLRAYAGMYTGELGKILRSAPAAIFRTLEYGSLEDQIAVSGMMDNLLNFKEGHKAIAEIVVDMASIASKTLLKSPEGNKNEAYQLGRFMAHVEKGIERNAKTREEAIEKGASILTYALKAAEKLTGVITAELPLGSKINDGFEKVYKSIEWLKKRDIDSVEETKKELISTMRAFTESAFRMMADPSGVLAGADLKTPAADNYKLAVIVFRQELKHGRTDVFEF
jgi:hypothetical protein